MNIFSIFNQSSKRAYHSKRNISLLLTAIFVGVFTFGLLGFAFEALACHELETCDFNVEFNGRTLDGQNDTSTWSYTLSEAGDCPDISHWAWEPCFSLEELEEAFVESEPEADSIGFDSSTGHYGVKWENLSTTTFSVTIDGQPDIDEEGATAVIKAGQAGDQAHGYQPHFDIIIPGPSCAEPEPECEPEQTRACDTGQLGVCVDGTQTCDEAGFWEECVLDIEPSVEICDDDLDDDCDGLIDCEDSDCDEDSACQPEPLIINAFKVVCEIEQDLPNWAATGTQSGEPSVISSSTAINYVENSQEKCWLKEEWDFQWGFSGQVQKLAGDHIGPALEETDWNDFSTSTGTSTPAEVSIYEIEDVSKIWVRENLKEGYVPFSNPPGDIQNATSAEMLCHDDILNFDNYDYIRNPQLGNTYYCVAFNALIEGEPESYCGDENLDEGEECDDGNTEDGDGCSSICLIEPGPGPEPVCGDSIVNGSEQCDEGQDNGLECVPEYGFSCIYCSSECQIIENENYPYCGDGILEQGYEECDDGNNDNDDGCSSECLIEEESGPEPECEPDVQEACDTGELGICSSGTQTCDSEGFWGECVQTQGSVQEVCNNGLDDDCDGLTDCDDDSCVENSFCEGEPTEPSCTSGETRVCGTGQLGICANGTQTCNSQGFWSVCVQDEEPSGEVCDNGLDDNCDGQTDCDDEFCEGLSICESGGGGGGGGPTCMDLDSDGYDGYNEIYCLTGDDCNDLNSDINPAVSESCGNGIDDNCDGQADCDDQECSEELSCAGIGGPQCTDSDGDGYAIQGDICGPVDCDDTNIAVNPAVSEICDNQIDDDCDGQTDCGDDDCSAFLGCQAVFPPETECTSGFYQLCSTGLLGACGRGVQICDSEGFWGSCLADNQPFSENCVDGVDNDCDGQIDCDDQECSGESVCEVVGPAVTECLSGQISLCDTGLWGICSVGTETCGEEGSWGACAPNHKPVTEVCDNGIDDDCDSYTDCNDSDCLGVAFCSREGSREESEASGFFETALAQVGRFFTNLFSTTTNIMSGIFGFLFGGAEGAYFCLPNCLPWWLVLILFLYSLIKTIRIQEKNGKRARTWLVWTLLLLIFAILFLAEIFPCLTIWVFLILITATFLIKRSLSKEEERQRVLFE